MDHKMLVSALSLAFLAFSPTTLHAQLVFTKVADTTMFPPGSSANFSTFGAPALHSGSVAFSATFAGSSGVFKWADGVIQKAADSDTTPPGGTGKFLVFPGYATENGKITFFGVVNPTPQGLYQFDGSSLVRLADTLTPATMPGGTGPFVGFSIPAMKDGVVAFVGQNSSAQRGLFSITGGTVSQRLAPGTPYPGGTGGFINPGGVITLDAGNIAFYGSDSTVNANNSIFTLVGSTLTRIAEKNVTLVPGSSSPFTTLGTTPDINGSKLAFSGAFSGGQGIYSVNLDGSGMVKLVDTTTTIPASTETFGGFGEFEFNGADLVFKGTSTGGQGLYLLRGGNITRIIDTFSPLAGKSPATLTFRESGYSAGLITFAVNFTDGSRGIYTSNINAIGQLSGGSFSAFSASVAGFSFTFENGTSGHSYSIQSSSTMAINSWSEVTNFPYTGPITVTDSSSLGAPRKFYKAVTQ
ncbi:MAG: hypothetical protein JWN25_1760 [Verrucomicrobiales bacterium]|nr:hypothetical protein [Verrucomicrobiales bacterium]